MRFEIFFTYPVELPVETGMFTDRHLQRPAEHTALNQFFQRFNGSTQSIERVSKTEPGIQTEHTSVLFHRFHHPFTFTDRTCHRLFTPDIFSRLGSLYRHDSMPMRRCSDVYDIYVRVQNQIAKVMISGNFFLYQLFS